MKNLSSIPENALLVMVGIVRLYPRIPLEKGLKHLDKQGKKSIPTGDLVKMVGSVLKNDF